MQGDRWVAGLIGILLIYGMPILAICWVVGLRSLWRGRPALSIWSAGLSILLAGFAAIFAMKGPRYSEFWMGGLGSGDGMGLIGMYVLGMSAAGVALIIFILTVVVAVTRKNHLNIEAPE